MEQDINVNTEVQGEQAPIDKQEVHEEKMLPQSKVNEIVESRLKREREKLEKQFTERINALEENIKLQAMSETEKANYQAQKERDAFEEERQAFYAERDKFNKDRYHSTIEQQLKAKGLPVDMADLLVGFDAETVASKIASMEQSFATQVNSSIEAKVKASASVPTTPQVEAKPLTLADINAMSSQEIKAHKAEVERVLKDAFKK